MNQAQNAGAQPGSQAQPLQVVEPKEVQIIRAQSAAQFALTPIGQQVKQFETQQRMAQMYSTSTIVPDTYRGNLGNCVIAIDMAMSMNANPLMIMQNLYIVHGNPSFSSKFLIATINASGRYSPLRYEWRGQEGSDSRACRVCAYEAWDKEHKDPLYGDWVSIEMAKKEGWYSKQGSKWQTMPNQMLRYRAAAFWQRVYCPEISMGLMTAEEYEDIDDQTGLNYQQEIRDNANGKQVSIDLSSGAQEAHAEQQPVKKEPKKQPTVEAEQPLGETQERPLFMQ